MAFLNLDLGFLSFCSLAVDENDSHASATHSTTFTTTTQAKKLKFPKSTFNRPQPLYSQKIVIGSEELTGNIENIVKQKINSLEKSPKVVRSTALIIKTSKTPSRAKTNGNLIKNGGDNAVSSRIPCAESIYSQEAKAAQQVRSDQNESRAEPKIDSKIKNGSLTKINTLQNISPSTWGQEILRNVGNGIDAIRKRYDSSGAYLCRLVVSRDPFSIFILYFEFLLG